MAGKYENVFVMGGQKRLKLKNQALLVGGKLIVLKGIVQPDLGGPIRLDVLACTSGSFRDVRRSAGIP